MRVPANDVLRAVRLTLQEPGGLLRGTVRDRVSDKPLLARLEFTRADRPQRLERADDDHVEWTNLRGEFTVALPDRPFNLVITDYLHDEWRSETELPAGFVQVRPGETMRVDVELDPQPGVQRP